GLKFGFEDEGAGTIAPCHAERRMVWSNEPPAVVGFPEQGGKARGRIETGPAQPIDRAVAADQSCRLAVADQRIVFDWQRHRFIASLRACQASPPDDKASLWLHRGNRLIHLALACSILLQQGACLNCTNPCSMPHLYTRRDFLEAVMHRITAILLVMFLAAPAARAQVTIEVSKITCEQYLGFSVADPRDINIGSAATIMEKRAPPFLNPTGLVSVRKHFESFESFVVQSGDLIREGHHRCGRRRTADVTTAANCDIRVT